MSVPGLDVIVPEKAAKSDVKLVGFDLQDIVIPEKYLYGNCRHLSTYQNIKCIKEKESFSLYKVVDKENGFKTVLLKKININTDNEASWFEFLHETNMLQNLKHENIVNLQAPTASVVLKKIYLAMDYCEYPLSSLLIEGKIRFDLCQIRNICKQLFSGLQYLHHHGIIHRNLKPSKILFTGDGCLKIGDLTQACKSDKESMSPEVGHVNYKAPELLVELHKYTTAVDIWAAGCIVAELLEGKVLFPGEDQQKTLAMIFNCLGMPNDGVWPGCSQYYLIKDYIEHYNQPYNYLKTYFPTQSPLCIHLLQRIFTYRPDIRLNADQILRHQFMEDHPLSCSNEQLVEHLADLQSKMS